MWTRVLQHDAAVAYKITCRTSGRSTLSCNTHHRINLSQFGRWQSTTTTVLPNKTTSLTPHDEEGNGISSSSFADKPSFPQPSFTSRAIPRNADKTINLTTTRPARLESPPPLDATEFPNNQIPITNRVKHLFRIGKSFLAFYKVGLKNIWANYKERRHILAKIQPHALDTVAKYGAQVRDGNTQLPSISRAEYQFCLRTRHDLLTLIPFSLVFMICGEFTPLVILAIGSSVVPYTCRIPAQEAKDLGKSLQRDKNFTTDLKNFLSTSTISERAIEHSTAHHLGLTPFRTPLPQPFQSLYHNMLLRPRLKTHLSTLVTESILTTREGGPSTLALPDLYSWSIRYSLHALTSYLSTLPASTLTNLLSNINHPEPSSIKDKSIQRDLDTLRRKILPAVEREMKWILNRDWERLKPTEHWRCAYSNLKSRGPDLKRRIEEMKD